LSGKTEAGTGRHAGARGNVATGGDAGSPGDAGAGASAGEVGAAVTDALVGLEAVALAHALSRRPVPATGAGATRAAAIHDAFVLFYASTAVAALSGAALHGLFADRRHPVRRGLWRVSLAAIGLSSLAAWRLGASLALRGPLKTRVIAAANGAHVLYEVGVVLTGPPYAVAIVSYAPGAAFLGWAFAKRLGDPADHDGAALGLAALGITGAAAAVQVLRIRVHARWLDSNALYHLVQAGGLAVFHLAAARLIEARPADADDRG
jgi:hypothetical protein